MLKLRILSSLVLIPLVLWALFGWPLPWFAAFIGLFILSGAWEWSALAGLRSRPARWAFMIAVTVMSIVVFLRQSWIETILAVAVVFWALVLVDHVRKAPLSGGMLRNRASRIACGLIILVATWVAIVALRQQPRGEWLSLFLYLLVWGADTGAYFSGSFFGKHKLAPEVSPGKTWEGVAGGIIWVMLLVVVTAIHFGWTAEIIAGWLGIAVAVGLVSVLGDLFESRIKRVAGVKDSGGLIPGHGGVLDRIDAMTAAAPLFVLAWLVWRVNGGTF